MDQYNWLVAEILVQQRQRELETQRPPLVEPTHSDGVRRSVGKAMVQLGLRLDPGAGERLALAHEGRR